MRYTERNTEVVCRYCGQRIKPKVEMTPEIIHYAKALCPHCGRFIDWVGKPIND